MPTAEARKLGTLRAASPESTQRRIIGRIGCNPVTWLMHQVERAADLSPETRAHIRGLFKKLRAKKGRLHCLDDETAEREYIRISYRLNFMRTQEAICRMKVGGKGYHTACKTLGIFAAATLKFKPEPQNRTQRPGNRRPVPSARLAVSRQQADETGERETEPSVNPVGEDADRA